METKYLPISSHKQHTNSYTLLKTKTMKYHQLQESHMNGKGGTIIITTSATSATSATTTTPIAQTKYKKFHSFWLWKRDIITRNNYNTLLENGKYTPKNGIEQIAQGL